MRRILALGCAAFMAATTASATEYFVDKNRPDDSGDGKTVETAKRTLRGAMEIPGLADDDVVTVLPGVYDEGVMTCADDSKATRRSRVIIQKKITLRSRDGRDATVIKGAEDTVSGFQYGLGPNAVTCVGVAKAGANSVIRGFTFLGGRSNNDAENGSSCGGGFYVYSGNAAIVYDSAFEDCVGTRGGAARYGTFVRCHFRNCRANNDGKSNKTNNGAAVREGKGFYFCTFTGCDGGGAVLEYCGVPVVHCTFYGNRKSIAANNDNTTFANCVIENGASTVNPRGKTFASCILSRPGVDAGTPDANCVFNVFGAGTVDPLRGDMRLAAAENPIAASAAQYAAIPEAYRGLDVDGNPVDEANLVPGAWAKAVECASGKVILRGNAGAKILVDGDALEIASGASNYFYEVEWPVRREVRFVVADAGKDVYRVNRVVNGTSELNCRAALTLDNRYGFVAPPVGDTLEMYPETATVWYVDCNSTSDAEDGTEANPYKTLAAACDALSNGIGVVQVKPGVYDRGSIQLAGAHNTRMAPQGGFLRVVGIEGAEKTIVVGAADPDYLTEGGEHDQDHDGCGPNAVRCFATAANCHVQGLTFTGGHTNRGASNSESGLKVWGAAVVGSTSSSALPGGAIISDCIITNNVGWRGAAAYGGTLCRCVIADNQNYRTDFLIYHSRLSNCLIHDNRACGASGSKTAVTLLSDKAYAYFCSIDEKDVKPWGAGAFLYDSVVRTAQTGAADVTMAGTFVNAVADFADADGGDYRLFAAAPAASGAVAVADGNWSWLAGLDIMGALNPFLPNGTVCGAFGETVASVLFGVSAGPVGGIAPSGARAVAPGDRFELTATDAATRLFEGFTVNGELVTTEPTYTYVAPSGVAKIADVVEAKYLSDWYVDAANGDDANRGDSPATAKRTLANALRHVVAGDTVHAAPGRYEEGTMLQATPVKSGTTPYIPSRVVIPSGVTLVGEVGAERTFIVGAADPDAGNQHGLGPNAVRCAFLENGATLRGFTLTGGRVDDVNLEDDNNHGAGALLGGDQAKVIDSTFTDNIAQRAAGGRYGTYVRCRFVGNRCTNNGAASRDGNYHGCYFEGNVGGITLNFWKRVTGCTFGYNNGNVLLGDSTFETIIDNTFFATSAANKVFPATFAAPKTCRNCVLPQGGPVPANVTVEESCVFAAQEQRAVDANGVPIVGVSAGIDRGSLENWDQWPDLATGADAAGNPRVSNGRMDIGCYEADWKPRYSKDLARRVTVTAASSETYEGEDGKSLVVPTGTVALDWAKPRGCDGGENAFKAQVTGNGTLTITLDGAAFATVVAADGQRAFTYPLTDLPANALTFTYTPGEGDVGAAVLSDFVGAKLGLTLLVK